MELDNLKESWKEANIKPIMDEEKIQHIINNQGHSAYNSLLNYEKLGIFLAIILLPLSLLFDDTALVILYLTSVPFMLIWQIYKYKFLKKIDLAAMNILNVSKKITMYKKYLSIEFFIGMIWGIVCCLLFVFRTLIVNFAKKNHINTDQVETSNIILWLLSAFLFLAVIGGLAYKFLYIRNIKRLQDSISEIQEFEQEMDD